MIDVRRVREGKKVFVKAYKRMKRPELLKDLDELVAKDEQLRKLQYDLDLLKAKRNQYSEEINKAKKAGGKVDAVLKKVKTVSVKIKKQSEKYDKVRAEVRDLADALPNLIHEKVPYGKDDSGNVQLKIWGKKPKFTFPVKNHVELLEGLDAVDFDASAKAAGNGFYYLKGDFALLNQALLQFGIAHMRKAGFQYVEVPLLLRKDVLLAGADAEALEQSIYDVEGEGLSLIGTSEYSLLAMHKGQVLTDLPKTYFSYSMCFRKEIGSHGINEKGLWRTHQFNKIEQFIFCSKEDSWTWYDKMMKVSEELFQALELPYRVLEICTGDLARWKARSADIEVWRPTTNDYGEVTSF